MAIFNTIGHIALWVKDLQQSIDFYGKLGIEEFLRLDQVQGTPWIVFLRVTDELYLELFPGGEGKPDAPRRVGVNHLCLTTDDIEKAAAHLAEVGVTPTTPLNPSRRGVDNNRGMWVTDPDGNRIEIMEMAPDSIQFEAIKAMRAGAERQTLLRPRMTG